ncbi:MAG TPA: pyrimidine reductase [Gammaproteobacteria bacterium]|nr:pyrimidine reductase [Gammaproteobacteria bacterium]
MAKDILQLYPDCGQRHQLQGLYLEQIPRNPAKPFIYSNFIASLDGRIALPASDRDSHQVPPAIANARDWRLFQELAAQADLLISSARYFRQALASEAQAELPLGQDRAFDDLRSWRRQQGLPAQPDIAVFSASLDIPPRALAAYRDRRVLILTGAQSDTARRTALEALEGVEVLSCGEGREVDAAPLKALLAQRGYRRIYAIAGSSVLHTLAAAGALDRLYLTTAHCLLGGKRFDTLAWGPVLEKTPALPLRALYLDTKAPEGAGQTLGVYGQ